SRSVCSFSSPERPEIEIIRYFNKVTHSHYRECQPKSRLSYSFFVCVNQLGAGQSTVQHSA
ncbi:hypothetical protein NFF72_11760, partial [Proteus mirabilis]|uniref:hypothetical protein n=1 Tax=Proteus mirabilis TaxID=584 RepID=UPI0023F8FA89